MAKTAMIRARTEPELKEQVEEIFHSLGLNQTEAINMFYHQVVLNRGLPFDIKLPNEETAEAIEAARNKEGEVFASAEDLFEDLGI
jgi:DNA-damage-inducible protein J